MSKRLSGKNLAKFEAERDVWPEVLAGVRGIKELRFDDGLEFKVVL